MTQATLFRSRPKARRASRVGQEIVVDNFAGAGGASLGIEAALGRAIDIAINHDPDAIDTHLVNHPATRHLCENVWKVDPVEACQGRPVGLAWFSPDCKHFSRAKGGKPVEKKIRALAWIVVRWIKAVRPRVIILENVREFADWGPLLDDGRPCPARKGLTFRRFVGMIRAKGYAVEWKVLNAADYGAPTHRRRLFLIARRDGKTIRWPEPTHGKDRLPYRTAAQCIDWSIPCPSIFDRAKPLAEKTLRRIALGIKRYVLDNPKPFIVRLGQTNGNGSYTRPCDDPLSTVTSKAEHCLVAPFVMKFRGDSAGTPATDPMPTITSGQGAARPAGAAHALGVLAPSLIQVNHGKDEFRGQSVEQPLGTVTGKHGNGLVAPTLVQTGYGERDGQAPRVPGIEKPLGTVVGGGQKHALVAAFLAKHYGGVVGHTPDRPLGTVTSVDHHGLVAASLARFNYGDKQWNGVDEPLGVVTSQGNKFGVVYSFLTKYFGTAIGQEVEVPLGTQTGKHRFGVVTVTVEGETYILADIGMRMLTPRELARAQGFPDDYVLLGPKSRQVAHVGNSVCPVMAEVLVRANYR